MNRTFAIAISAVAFAAGCQQDKPPQWSGKGGGDHGTTAESSSGGAPPSGDVEARLARVEKKLDKITGFLKQAVRPELDTTLTYGVPIDPLDPVIGPKDAKVTIVEAYEYLCPYCNMVSPTMEKVIEAYPNDVRVVPKYLVIHGPPAVPAGLAMCAAGKQGKAHEMQKALWGSIWGTNQQPDRDKASAENVQALASTVGLDAAKLKADMDSQDCQQWLSHSAATLEKFGTTGTPSFYVNGKFVGGQDFDAFKKMIDDEIKKVDASGVKPADYYDKVVIGKGEPQAHMISPFDD
ncbi:MAG TPA: DsbA family protein [Kofleriaceae bacterium]|nr:DsbA family protein [Kofleriaceae bacterium]